MLRCAATQIRQDATLGVALLRSVILALIACTGIYLFPACALALLITMSLVRATLFNSLQNHVTNRRFDPGDLCKAAVGCPAACLASSVPEVDT